MNLPREVDAARAVRAVANRALQELLASGRMEVGMGLGFCVVISPFSNLLALYVLVLL
jgi:hypothetical protein